MMLRRRGFEVRGSDSTDSTATRRLLSEGIAVQVGHALAEIDETDALVLTDAIDLATNPEVARAERLGCLLFRRSQVLGWLLRDKKTIAVTGTHGKTTTTGMIGAGLIAAGQDPTIVVGAVVPEWGSAVVEGQGEWVVIEACEAYDSLRDYDPTVAVLTNLEMDHADFHGDWEGLKACVARFAERVPAEGALVYNADDPGALEIADSTVANSVAYCEQEADGILADLALPGAHNAQNAAGALAAIRATGTDPVKAAQGVAAFRGAERRLEVVRANSPVVIDDYAHHPTEIAASLEAIRSRYCSGGKRLVLVYQPHLYSRTAGLIPEFAEALSSADVVVLTDIYPARENPIPGISSARIAELVTKPIHYVSSRHLLARVVRQLMGDDSVVVVMGAGNIDRFAPALLEELDRSGPTKVVVLYGGDSTEREVSLISGAAVAAGLERCGYQVSLLDVTETLFTTGDLSGLVGAARPNVAFLALHGTNAEDGAIQGLLKLLHLPFTGSDLLASALAMDKRRAKALFAEAGLPVARGLLLCGVQQTGCELERAGLSLEERLVVKPNAQGSTVGLSFVQGLEELESAIRKALAYDREALVEEHLDGVEISVPVLGDRALPVVEIVPQSGRYDFASKYAQGGAQEICPARLTEQQTRIVQEYALRAHRALGCAGATRTDMIVTSDRIVLLELNTLPGMTPTSLLPNSAAAAGIEFDELCDWIVQDALKRATDSVCHG